MSFTDQGLFLFTEAHLDKVACLPGAYEQKTTLIFMVKQMMTRKPTWRKFYLLPPLFVDINHLT